MGLKFKYIKCVDFKHKFYYAYLFSEDKHIYILTQYDYLLTKFPLENIDPVENEIRIYGDLFNYNVISIGEGNLVSYILDKDYQKIDEYSESWLVQNQKKEGEIAQLLFPFQLKMTNSKSGFIKFFFERNQSFYWLILSLVLSFIHFLILSKRKVKITNHIFDMLIIVCFGIFGLAAVNFFPNKFYD